MFAARALDSALALVGGLPIATSLVELVWSGDGEGQLEVTALHRHWATHATGARLGASLELASDDSVLAASPISGLALVGEELLRAWAVCPPPSGLGPQPPEPILIAELGNDVREVEVRPDGSLVLVAAPSPWLRPGRALEIEAGLVVPSRRWTITRSRIRLEPGRPAVEIVESSASSDAATPSLQPEPLGEIHVDEDGAIVLRGRSIRMDATDGIILKSEGPIELRGSDPELS